MQETRDAGSIPGLGRSPGEGNGHPLQYCLGNPMDREAWQATAHGVIRIGHNLATKQQFAKWLETEFQCILLMLSLLDVSSSYSICYHSPLTKNIISSQVITQARNMPHRGHV